MKERDLDVSKSHFARVYKPQLHLNPFNLQVQSTCILIDFQIELENLGIEANHLRYNLFTKFRSSLSCIHRKQILL